MIIADISISARSSLTKSANGYLFRIFFYCPPSVLLCTSSAKRLDPSTLPTQLSTTVSTDQTEAEWNRRAMELIALVDVSHIYCGIDRRPS